MSIVNSEARQQSNKKVGQIIAREN